MVAAYPNATPSFTTKVDQVDINFADHINRLQDEVQAIAVELGSLPKGSHANVRTRLEALNTGKSNTGHAHVDQYWHRSLITNKGQILAGTGPKNLLAVTPSANNRVLVSDSTAGAGVRFSTLTHSVFSDLTEDNYPQYALADGTRGAFLRLSGGEMTGPTIFAGIGEKIEAKGNISGSVEFDAQEGSAFSVTMTGTLTPTFTGASMGVASPITILFTQDATGGRVWHWPSSVIWVGSGPPEPGGPNEVALVSVVSFDGGASWIGIALTQF